MSTSKIVRPEWAFICALLLLAACLRIIGVDHGQPDPQYDPSYAPYGLVNPNIPIHPDEFLFVTRPLEMLLTGKLNPKFFHNPSLLINLNFVTYVLTNSGAGLSLADRDPRVVSGRSFAPFPLYVIGRVYSALGGLLAVAGAYALARRMAGRWAAAGAGLLTAVSLPLVQHAHYTTTSSLAAGFSMVCIFAAFLSLEAQGRRQALLFIAAGICSGLAAGSRYNAAAVSLVVFFCGLLLAYRHRTRRTMIMVLAGWCAFPLTFILTTPWVIADTAFFFEEFRFITAQYTAGEGILFTTSGWHGLLLELRYLALFGVGAPATFAAGVGVGACWRARDGDQARRNANRFIVSVLLFVLSAYALVVLRTPRPGLSDQMLLPILPVITVFAGVGAAWLIAHFPLHRVAAPVLIVMLALLPLFFSLQVVSLLAQRDTRYRMQAWVYAALPTGAHIHLLGPYNIPLDPAMFTVTQSFADQPMPSADRLRVSGVEYVVLSDAWYHDVLRSGAVIPLDYQVAIQDYLIAVDRDWARIAWIERPTVVGSDWIIHSASYWHQPRLTLYCLTDAACAAVRWDAVR